jgi:hypothetical protein
MLIGNVRPNEFKQETSSSESFKNEIKEPEMPIVGRNFQSIHRLDARPPKVGHFVKINALNYI